MDIGGGTTEVAFSLGNIVFAPVRVGGDKIRSNYRLYAPHSQFADWKQHERIKKNIGGP